MCTSSNYEHQRERERERDIQKDKGRERERERDLQQDNTLAQNWMTIGQRGAHFAVFLLS